MRERSCLTIKKLTKLRSLLNGDSGSLSHFEFCVAFFKLVVGGEVCTIWEIFGLLTSLVGTHNSKNMLPSSSVGALQGAVCHSFFAL